MATVSSFLDILIQDSCILYNKTKTRQDNVTFPFLGLQQRTAERQQYVLAVKKKECSAGIGVLRLQKMSFKTVLNIKNLYVWIFLTTLVSNTS